jgi:hypothetical protein
LKLSPNSAVENKIEDQAKQILARLNPASIKGGGKK